MSVFKQKIKKTPVQQQNQSVNVKTNDFYKSRDLEKLKVFPKNRLFNSFMAIMIITIAICLGVIIGCLFIIFL